MSKNTIDKILNWQTQLMIKQGVLQQVSENKKLNITAEMVSEAREEARQALYQDLMEMQKTYITELAWKNPKSEQAIPVESVRSYFGVKENE